MENNQKMAILSFKKNKYFKLLRSRPTNPIDHKSLEKEKAQYMFLFFFKLKIAIFGLFSIMAQFGCLVSDGEP